MKRKDADAGKDNRTIPREKVLNDVSFTVRRGQSLGSDSARLAAPLAQPCSW
jgi:ABC-type polysaccharide/polyol phosphate transport system ATPase subunit